MRYLTIILLSATALGLSSCIKNDIPYPTVELNIESVEGAGFTVAEINASECLVRLALDEKADIQHLAIDKVGFSVSPHNTTLTKEALLQQMTTSRPLVGTFDLRTPIYVTLSLYQDYHWTILAEQTIDRHFNVSGQIGATVFDVDNLSATAYVAKDADRSQITVTKLKLGPAEISTQSPSIEELSTMDFTTVHFAEVTYHGRTEQWKLYVLPTEKSVRLTAADAWSEVVWLSGTGIEGVKMGFQYLKAGEDEWQEVPNVRIKGGTFSADFVAEPQTTYQFRAYCASELSDPKTVTTEAIAQLPNSGFEEWCTIAASNNYGVVYPYAEKGTPYWGTGNVGASMASETLTDKGSPRPGSEGIYSANLRSKFANIAGIGKFAAGNLFTGKYVRTAVTDGILTFGRSFTLRPTGMRIRVKYNCGKVDKIKKLPPGTVLNIGDNDTGIIYIALGTWTAAEYGKDSEGKPVGTEDSPHCIDTRDANTLFKPNSKDVVGYGEYLMTQNVDEWQERVIPIVYPAKNITPTHVIVVCSASRLGDYFSGSTSSEMWVDDFELIYTPLPTPLP